MTDEEPGTVMTRADADDGTAQEGDSPPKTRFGRLKLICAGGIALSMVFMLVAGFGWWRAATDESIDLAQTRDKVLVTAYDRIEVLNTLDYRDVDAGLKSWLDATTGTLNDQLAQVGKEDRQLLRDQEKVTTAKVVDAALIDLDDGAGTATAIASLEITVKGTTGEPSVKRNRFSANLVRVDGDWLLENLQQVAVNIE